MHRKKESYESTIGRGGREDEGLIPHTDEGESGKRELLPPPI
jgi:hypothetical protein